MQEKGQGRGTLNKESSNVPLKKYVIKWRFATIDWEQKQKTVYDNNEKNAIKQLHPYNPFTDKIISIDVFNTEKKDMGIDQSTGKPELEFADKDVLFENIEKLKNSIDIIVKQQSEDSKDEATELLNALDNTKNLEETHKATVNLVDFVKKIVGLD